MAITFNGCGSRVVLCTWAHDFAILDPHSLALLTICCSLYFCIQVDGVLEDYASQGKVASRAAQCVGARRGSSPGMLDSQWVARCTECRPRGHAGFGPNASVYAGDPVQACQIRQCVARCTECRPRGHAGFGPLGYVGSCDADSSTIDWEWAEGS